MKNDAQICRDRGWHVGTRLVVDEGYGPTVIQITAIGEERILAKVISHNGEPRPEETECAWMLGHWDWKALSDQDGGPGPEGMEAVMDYSDRELVARAVRGARPRRAGPAPRWVAVKDTFSLGSTYAHELCRLHGLDPDEEVPSAWNEARRRD